MSDRPSEIGFLPTPHDSLAPESRQPPEFRSPSPPPRDESRGRALSELCTLIPLSGRFAGSKRKAAFSGPSLSPPCPMPPSPLPLPPRCERFRLCHREPPGPPSMPSPLPETARIPARHKSARPGVRDGREGGASGRCPRGLIPGPRETRAGLRTEEQVGFGPFVLFLIRSSGSERFSQRQERHQLHTLGGRLLRPEGSPFYGL